MQKAKVKKSEPKDGSFIFKKLTIKPFEFARVLGQLVLALDALDVGTTWFRSIRRMSSPPKFDWTSCEYSKQIADERQVGGRITTEADDK